MLLGDAIKQARATRTGGNSSSTSSSSSATAIFPRSFTAEVPPPLPLVSTSSPKINIVSGDTAENLSIGEQLRRARLNKIELLSKAQETKTSSKVFDNSFNSSKSPQTSTNKVLTSTSSLKPTVTDIDKKPVKKWNVPNTPSLTPRNSNVPAPKSYIPNGASGNTKPLVFVKSVVSTPIHIALLEAHSLSNKQNSGKLLSSGNSTKSTKEVQPSTEISNDAKLQPYIQMQKEGIPDEIIKTKMLENSKLTMAEIKAFFFFNQSIISELIAPTAKVEETVISQNVEPSDYSEGQKGRECDDNNEEMRMTPQVRFNSDDSLGEVGIVTEVENQIVKVETTPTLSSTLLSDGVSDEAATVTLLCECVSNDENYIVAVEPTEACVEKISFESLLSDVESSQEQDNEAIEVISDINNTDDITTETTLRDSLLSPESAKAQQRPTLLSAELLTSFKEMSYGGQENPFMKSKNELTLKKANLLKSEKSYEDLQREAAAKLKLLADMSPEERIEYQEKEKLAQASDPKNHEDQKIGHLLKLGSTFYRGAGNSLKNTRHASSRGSSLRNTPSSATCTAIYSERCSTLTGQSKKLETVEEPSDIVSLTTADDMTCSTAPTADFSSPHKSNETDRCSFTTTATILSNQSYSTTSTSVTPSSDNFITITVKELSTKKENTYTSSKKSVNSRRASLKNTLTAILSARDKVVLVAAGKSIKTSMKNEKLSNDVDDSHYEILDEYGSRSDSTNFIADDELVKIQEEAMRQQMIRAGHTPEFLDLLFSSSKQNNSSTNLSLSQSHCNQADNSASMSSAKWKMSHQVAAVAHKSTKTGGFLSFFKKLF